MPPLDSFSPHPSNLSVVSVASVDLPKRPPSPVETPLPPYASTSTISRSSRASGESSNSEVELPPSASRIPKAPVFVQRDRLSLKPRVFERPNPHVTGRVELRGRKGVEGRCVSDMHEALRWQSVAEDDTPWKAERTERIKTTLGADVDEQSWASSWRNLSLYKARDKPCIRGSILEVRPPTLGERFGLKRGRGRNDREERGDDIERRGDDYVGFLVERRERASRRIWKRILKRF